MGSCYVAHNSLAILNICNSFTPAKIFFKKSYKSSSHHFDQRIIVCHNLGGNVLNDKMDLKDLAIGIVFLLQSTVGILGNLSLCSCYLIHYHTEQTLKTRDVILIHFFIENFLIILSNRMLETIGALGMKGFFNDFSCNFFCIFKDLAGACPWEPLVS